MWASIGLMRGAELHGGHQSRVFAAEHAGQPVAVKLTDRRFVDARLQQRLELTVRLAGIDDSIVAPLALDGALATELGGWVVVISPLVAGEAPDASSEADVRRMAATLARLHAAFEQVDVGDLAPVAALRGREASGEDLDGFGSWQLLHGDFSRSNLLFDVLRVGVLDFDDCGAGPIEFEVGNTLYMELFDAAMSSNMARFDRFREWFLDEYRSTSGRSVPDDLVQEAIGLRVAALQRWIDQPETAPIGIRTATPEWRESLRAFVRSHRTR